MITLYRLEMNRDTKWTKLDLNLVFKMLGDSFMHTANQILQFHLVIKQNYLSVSQILNQYCR